MTKPIDRDILSLRAAVRALNLSTSRRMLRANMEFLYDRFLNRPSPYLPKHLAKGQP